MSVKRERVETEIKTGRVPEAMKRYGLGRNAVRDAAVAAGAVIKLGRSYLINFDRMDAYMDSLSGKGVNADGHI